MWRLVNPRVCVVDPGASGGLVCHLRHQLRARVTVSVCVMLGRPVLIALNSKNAAGSFGPSFV